jgi:IS1 family transposase
MTTSHIESQNFSIRHFNKRFCRLTLGYSKKLMNLRYAVALYVAQMNR